MLKSEWPKSVISQQSREKIASIMRMKPQGWMLFRAIMLECSTEMIESSGRIPFSHVQDIAVLNIGTNNFKIDFNRPKIYHKDIRIKTLYRL
jgi:hypothetical protein